MYAAGDDEPSINEIVGHKVYIHCHSIDLAQQPLALLNQVSQLAEKIAERAWDAADRCSLRSERLPPSVHLR